MLYDSDMNRVGQAVEERNFNLAVALLKRHASGSDENVRGFEWYYLWNCCKRGLVTPRLSTEFDIRSSALSPDGRTLAVVGYVGGMLMDVSRGVNSASENQIALGKRVFLTAAFSPGGQFLAAAGDGVEVWGFSEGGLGTESILLTGHTGIVTCIAFSARRTDAGHRECRPDDTAVGFVRRTDGSGAQKPHCLAWTRRGNQQRGVSA